MMNGRYAPLTTAQLDPDAASLYDAILASRRAVADVIGLVRVDGSLRGPFDPLLRSPVIGDVVQHLGSAVRSGSSLSAAVCEVAILTTVDLLECAFEKDAHAKLAISRNVLELRDTRAITDGRPDHFTERDFAVVWNASREQVQRGSLTTETLVAAIEVFGERGVVDLTVLVAYYQLVAALMHNCAPSPPVE